MNIRFFIFVSLIAFSCTSENTINIKNSQAPQNTTSTSSCPSSSALTLDASQSFSQGTYNSLSNQPSAENICSGTTVFGVTGTANCLAPGEVPTTITGLKTWFRADSKTYSDSSQTDAVNGDALYSWGGNHTGAYSLSQSNATNQPSFIAADTGFNNQSVLSFDGNDKMFFNIGLFNSNFIEGSYTMFVVLSSTDTNAHVIGTASSQNGFLESWGAGFYLGASGEIKYKVIDNSSGLKISSTTTDFSNATIVTLSTDCSNTTLYVNGSSESTSTTACQKTIYTHSSIGASDGYGDGAIIDPFVGKIAEYIVYESNLSTTNRETVECYLASRYAITVGHSCN